VASAIERPRRSPLSHLSSRLPIRFFSGILAYIKPFVDAMSVRHLIPSFYCFRVHRSILRRNPGSAGLCLKRHIPQRKWTRYMSSHEFEPRRHVQGGVLQRGSFETVSVLDDVPVRIPLIVRRYLSPGGSIYSPSHTTRPDSGPLFPSDPQKGEIPLDEKGGSRLDSNRIRTS
jgi:hypothetical protein